MVSIGSNAERPVSTIIRPRKGQSQELNSVIHEYVPGRCKLAVKVVDIFGNNTMKIVEVRV
jgi:hypothetical protein